MEASSQTLGVMRTPATTSRRMSLSEGKTPEFEDASELDTD
jgi:hypothetical protein